MKILNIESDTKKLHIQKKDLILLEKLYTGITISSQKFPYLKDDKNLNSFITITNEEDIEIIKCISFIIDYRYYRALKIDDLQEEIKKIKRKDLNKEIKKHIIKQLQQIIDIKENTSNIELPMEIDYYGYHYSGTDEENEYVISPGLDPNTLFYYRKDHNTFSTTDDISTDLIEKAIQINHLQRSKQDEIISEYDETYQTSPDQKYCIIKIKPITKNKRLIKSLKNINK